MIKTYRLGYRMISYILLISFLLQSCGGLGNTPIIPIKKEQPEPIQRYMQAVNPQNTQPLTDQTLRAAGGHAVTFYEVNGDLQASVESIDDRHRVYNGVPVLIEKGTTLSSLLHLPKRVQQNHIHIQQDKRGQFTGIVIQKTSGLMGGEESEDEDEGQKKRDTIRKGKEKANDDQYYEDDEQEEKLAIQSEDKLERLSREEKGTEKEGNQDTDLEVNNNYWYEDIDVQAILLARVKDITRSSFKYQGKSVHVLAAVDDIIGKQLQERLIQAKEPYQGKQQILLIPCNLGNYHWVGILIEISADQEHVLRAEYIDPLHGSIGISKRLQDQFKDIYPDASLETYTLLKQDDDSSCGAYTIENLLLAMQEVEIPKLSITDIRQSHLKCLRSHSPEFYKRFYIRQKENIPTNTSIQEQLGYYGQNQSHGLSKQEIRTMLKINSCLESIEDEELKKQLCTVFEVKKEYESNHEIHLNAIRDSLKQAILKLDKVSNNELDRINDKELLTDLIELLFGLRVSVNEASEAIDIIENEDTRFRLAYDIIIKSKKINLRPDTISSIEKTLSEQIKEDEEFAIELQEKLWGEGEKQIHSSWHGNSKTRHEIPKSYEEALEALKSNNPKIGIIDLSQTQEVLDRDKLNTLKEYIRSNSFVGWIHWGKVEAENEKLKKEIEETLIQNICNYSYHPTDYVHGLFAKHVYCRPKQGDKVNLQVLSQELGHELSSNLSNTWEIVQVEGHTDNSGYYSALYVNEATHQAVLSFQGTQTESILRILNNEDLAEDLVSVLANTIITEQQNLTYKATEKAVEYAKHKGFHLSMTGHSLGAYLAELSVIFCYRKFNYTEVKAIVFDSPGIGEKAQSLKPNIISKRTKFNPASLPILSYLSAPNIVNICNPHVGEIYRINPDLKLEDWVDIRKKISDIPIGGKQITDKVSAILSIKGHKLEFILKTFDPITGKSSERVRMDNWPKIKLESSFYDKRGKFLGTKGIMGRLAGLKATKNLAIPRVIPRLESVIMSYAGVIPIVGWLVGWGITRIFSMLINLMAGQAGALAEDIVDKNFCLLNALIALGLDYKKIDLSQFWQTMKNLDGNYKVSDSLPIGERFKLEFAGKYKETSLDHVDVHALNIKNSKVDKCLYSLYKLKQNPKYEEVVDELSKTNFYVRVLKKISGDYNVDGEIKLKKGSIRLRLHQTDIEVTRDRMRRALEILTPQIIEITIKNIEKSIENLLVSTSDAELSSCIVKHHNKRLDKYTKQVQAHFQDPLEKQVEKSKQQLMQQRNNPFRTAMVCFLIFILVASGFYTCLWLVPSFHQPPQEPKATPIAAPPNHRDNTPVNLTPGLVSYFERHSAQFNEPLIQKDGSINFEEQEDLGLLLHKDAGSTRKDVVEYLIKKGININIKAINIKDNYGNTPLHVAARDGQTEVIQYLIDKGADKEAKDMYGNTLLYWACVKGDLEVVKCLIDKGAHVNAKDKHGNIPLHRAAENGHTEVVKYLIENGAHVNAKDGFGNRPLHKAAENGQTEVVKYLIDKGDVLYAKNNNGDSPLHKAASKGYTEVAKYLIEQGADKGAKDKLGNTPLHKAAKDGHTEVVQYLIDKGADINAKDNLVRTSLHRAAEGGHTEVVQCLIDKGADKEAKNNNGDSPLHKAAENGHTEVVQYLIDKGADVNAKADYGDTLLHMAAENGHTEVVQYLIENRADINAKDKHGNTPLHVAVENGHTKVAKYLIDKGANKEAKGGIFSFTPLHLAASKGYIEVVQYLIKNGANANAKADYRSTALHVAAENGQTEVVQYLIENGADKEAKAIFGNTPLHKAAKDGHTEVVQYLIENGANVNAKDKHGNIPLHKAAEGGHTEVIQYLIDKGADK